VIIGTGKSMLFLLNQLQNGDRAVFFTAFGLMAITNEPLKLGV
jgi:hypothetical protein